MGNGSSEETTVLVRLNTIDQRMEGITTELDSIRAICSGSSAQVSSSRGGSSGDDNIAALTEANRLANTAIMLGQQVESKFSDQGSILEMLSSRVEALTEVGQW